MIAPYQQVYTVLSSDTDAKQRLRLSRLLTLLQEAAIVHTTQLGFGREKTLDKGYLWVITVQQALISRLPRYDETITLTSLPGEMMHTFYPRYYRITDEEGNELVNASALWTLMDRETRGFVFPDVSGVAIDGSKPDGQAFYPRPPKLPPKDNETRFTVPYSAVDLNGHMNNTRYFDLAEDLMDPALREADVKELSVEYTGEARCGDELTLTYGVSGGTFLLSGTKEKRLFRLGIRYDV
ncbi:MAG: hypothetical protein IJK89_05855 [Clostridia bacterium]|nr:hypothetical protein [Clostridia bacterium]